MGTEPSVLHITTRSKYDNWQNPKNSILSKTNIKIIKFKQILETPEKKTVNLDDPKDDLFKDNEIFADMKNPIFVPFT